MVPNSPSQHSNIGYVYVIRSQTVTVHDVPDIAVREGVLVGVIDGVLVILGVAVIDGVGVLDGVGVIDTVLVGVGVGV